MYFDVSKRGKVRTSFDIKVWSYASAQQLLTDRLTSQLCAVGITLSVITHPCSPGITNQERGPYIKYCSSMVRLCRLSFTLGQCLNL